MIAPNIPSLYVRLKWNFQECRSIWNTFVDLVSLSDWVPLCTFATRIFATNDCAVHTVHSIKCTWYSVCTAYGARRIISQARAALACLRAAHLSRIRCGADLPGSALRGGGKGETATAFNKTIKINKIIRHDMLKQTRSRAHTHTQHHQNRKLSNARAAAAASLSTKTTTTMRLWIIAHKHACTHAIDK